MSKKMIFEDDVKVPKIVQQKASEAFSQIELKGEKNMSKNHKNLMKTAIVAAACMAFIVTTSSVSQHKNLNEQVENSNSTAVTENILHDFSITAYAAELDVLPASDGTITFVDAGEGEGGYTGIRFSIQGNDISDVYISIDKGELYSATIEETTQAAIKDWLGQGAPDEDGNSDTYTILQTAEIDDNGIEVSDTVWLHHCLKCGNEISEEYNSEKYYAFYIPDSVKSDESDLAVAYQNELQIFNNATLKIAITYTDGQTQTKEYTLSVTKLAVDNNGNITNEEWTDGNENAYVYSILAKEMNMD